MIRAIIFDFDGLILETESPVYQSWHELYDQFGMVLSKQEWSQIIGTSDAEHFDPLDELEVSLHQSLPRSELLADRREREMELIREQGILPGVEKWIDQAVTMGMRLGIASSSSRDWVYSHLTRLGLIDHFEVIRTADDVEKTKPDPALYHQALDSLSISANEAIVLEDSPNGVTAAKRAGIFTIAVPNPMTVELNLDHADLQISSLEELDLQGAISYAENRKTR
ncbi:MAG: HAD-IA family hydrolase [Gammaproteobacteria bacterium]|nr:HAD-IA family hydrolase [Gammaproteobacteria bacterium]